MDNVSGALASINVSSEVERGMYDCVSKDNQLDTNVFLISQNQKGRKKHGQ